MYQHGMQQRNNISIGVASAAANQQHDNVKA